MYTQTHIIVRTFLLDFLQFSDINFEGPFFKVNVFNTFLKHLLLSLHLTDTDTLDNAHKDF